MEERKEITIGESTYFIKEMTIKDFLAIRAMKSRYSNGQYQTWMQEGTWESEYSLDLTDTLAYLSVLVPEATKNIEKYESILEIPINKSMPLVKVYREQLSKIIKPLIDEMATFYEELNKDKKGKK